MTQPAAEFVAAFEGAAREKTARYSMRNGRRWVLPALSEADAPVVTWRPSEKAGLWLARFHRSNRGKILAVVECGYDAGSRVCRLIDDRREAELEPVADD